MSREFDLDEILSFPDPLVEKYLEGYHIVLAPQNPNWIILNTEEYNMFKYLQEGKSLREALENYYSQYCDDENECIRVMTNLLEQIHDVDFSSDAIISEEEPIETITKKVHIGTTNGCNMRCKHCYMAAGKTPLETIDIDNTIRIIKGLNKTYGKLEIVVSGGEPLTYKHIYNLLEHIKDNYIILFTNGSLITEDNADIIAECCNEVQISFEGITPECYGLVRDIEKYDAVINALRLLKNRNVKIVLAVTLLPDTMYDIQKNLIDFIKSLDYNNVEVRINDDIELSGNAVSMDITKQDQINSNEIVIQMIRELDSIGCSVQNNDIRNTRFTNCGIGTSVVINYDGNVYPCHKFSSYSIAKSADVDQIIEEFNVLNRQTSNNNIVKCQNCDLKYICSGGCRIDHYLKSGSMTQVSCDEEFKNQQLLKLIRDYRMYREKVEYEQ
ncbi:MAG: radical SAM protein [Oscillospiraceae bacterium]|nr:radical SAM protein [Oscillospiraceae bacterium]